MARHEKQRRMTLGKWQRLLGIKSTTASDEADRGRPELRFERSTGTRRTGRHAQRAAMCAAAGVPNTGRQVAEGAEGCAACCQGGCVMPTRAWQRELDWAEAAQEAKPPRGSPSRRPPSSPSSPTITIRAAEGHDARVKAAAEEMGVDMGELALALYRAGYEPHEVTIGGYRITALCGADRRCVFTITWEAE